MAPSLRIHPPSSSDLPVLPTPTLVPSRALKTPETEIEVVASNLRFRARVPMVGIHSSNHNSDAMRTHLHLSNPSSIIDLDPVEQIEFDGPLSLSK